MGLFFCLGGGTPVISICLDLSSKCIGSTFAQTVGSDIKYINTLPIVPNKPNGLDFGYTTKEPKPIDYRGATFKGFLLPDELQISKTEADKRNAEFKVFKHRMLLKDIGKQVGKYIDKLKPDIIVIERNSSFGGTLTTKLLAEIAGGLYFYTGAKNIEFYDYNESTVRAFIRKSIPNVDRTAGLSDKMALDTKWEIYCRLKQYFEENHPGLLNFEGMTMDESDSLATFYYLYKTVILPRSAT